MSFERGLGQTLLRVYALRPACVRLDMTTASRDGQVNADGLFQVGYSKDQRPDVPQLTVALATLDPLGVPLATDVAPGDRADDPLYVPLLQRVRATVLQRGLLYSGDCTMGALLTRATIHEGHDHDLCPLAATQVPGDVREGYLVTARASGPAERVERVRPDGTREHRADSYECRATLSASVDGWRPVTWTERRLLLRSLALAQAQEPALRARVARAHQTITALTVRRRGKPRLATVAAVAAVQQAAAAILTHERVAGLVHVTVSAQVQERRVRADAGRPAQVRQVRTLQAQARVDTSALAAAVQRLGWRVYATNAPAQDLTATQAVLAYRQEFLIERAFGRLKGRPLSLTPLYLERDAPVSGLIRLLSVAVRVLTTVEHAVRQRLSQEQRTLAGLYAGSPTRATAQPPLNACWVPSRRSR